jgi:Fe-S-cluster containining protein
MNYCNYCPGYCCYRLKGSVLLLDSDDINRIARHYSISDGEVRKRFLENRKNTFKLKEDGSCIFQSSAKMVKRCTIHPVRPRQCRMFPYGEPCPYLERDDLLNEIQPRVESGLKSSWQKK